MLSSRRRGRLCLGRARNGLSDEDEQEVLKPTSRGLSAGKGGTHADREAERTITLPPHRLSPVMSEVSAEIFEAAGNPPVWGGSSAWVQRSEWIS